MERLGSDMFGAILGRRGRDDLDEAVLVRRIWAKAVGESLAKELWPGRVEDRCLQVFTESSAWLSEARFLESRILRKLAKLAPRLKLESIRFRLAKEGRRVERPTLRVTSRDLGPEEVERIQGVVEEVKDPALRRRLESFFRKAAAREVSPAPEDGLYGEDSGDQRG